MIIFESVEGVSLVGASLSVGIMIGALVIVIAHEVRGLFRKSCGMCSAPYGWRKK